MIETILLTALSSQLTLLNPTISSAPPTPQVVFTRVLPQENYVSYVVKKNDTLKSIALTYYGSENDWATLQKDNSEIKTPDNLVAGTLLKIRVATTDETYTLPAQFMQKNSAFANQLNEPTAGASAAPSVVDTPVPYETPALTFAPTAVPTVQEVTITPVPTVAVSNAASPISDGAFNYLGSCEAGMDPTKNTGNGYYGAFQFSYGTWKRLNTGYERADLAPIEVQKAAVKQLLQRSSIYGQFPACARKMHAAGMI